MAKRGRVFAAFVLLSLTCSAWAGTTATEVVLHNFGGSPPRGAGNLYGTTSEGGVNEGGGGLGYRGGILFKIKMD